MRDVVHRERACPTMRSLRATALAAALDAADVVCVSGGVSVGPHDHVKPALAELGVARALLGRAAPAGEADLVRHDG